MNLPKGKYMLNCVENHPCEVNTLGVLASNLITLFKGSTKTGMLCAKSKTCSPQLPEYLTVRYSQRQKQTIAMAAGFCTPLKVSQKDSF